MQAQQTPVYVMPAHVAGAAHLQAKAPPAEGYAYHQPAGVQYAKRTSDVSGKSYTVDDVSSSLLESSVHDDRVFSSATQSEYN